jgi:hypothetical protein
METHAGSYVVAALRWASMVMPWIVLVLVSVPLTLVLGGIRLSIVVVGMVGRLLWMRVDRDVTAPCRCTAR